MRTYSLQIVFFLLSVTTFFAQELKLGSPFQEHMVLQRDMPLNIWGEAKPDAMISVFIDGVSVKTQTNSKGEWQVVIPSQKAGGPYSFKVESETDSIVFNDVMVGEVWICFGQSNMQMGYNNIPDIKALEAVAKNIRTLQVERTVSFDEQKYVNGEWKIENPASAVAFSFAHFLQESADVPVGIILTSWGSSSIEGWMPRAMTKQLPHFNSIMNDFDADTAKQKRIVEILAKGKERTTKEDIFLRTQPNIIFNSMLNPLIPISCRGLVWYQGEANTKSIEAMLQYGESLPLWVKHLRKLWENKELQIMGITLPGFVGNKKNKNNPSAEKPDDLSWAWFRESQYKLLELSNAEMITTIDLGEAHDIHPKDKLPIGKRLALMAEKTFINKDITAEGPKLNDVIISSKSITIMYENAKGLKTNDGNSPLAFWLANDTKEWHKADAKINGETIVLTSSKVKHPLYVRYAFSAKPEVNLVNEADLPAQPFRTDSFKPVP
ncbi:sialate O-acetylesterase [Aurantibacter sp.]|uniref:sialate O-acetylesterase n=1 Tax=Aurantibacter sp. TaxID=2807103 RepID=UPI0032631EE6